MARQRITVTDSGATLIIDPEVLSTLGIRDGDEVDVSIVDRTVLLRPVDEAERARKLDAVTQAILRRREHLFRQLTDDEAR